MNDIATPPTKSRAPTPFRDLAAEPFGWLRGEIDRLFDGFPAPARGMLSSASRVAPVPAVEMVDEEKNYRLTVELPGLAENDIEIAIADDVLSISGEKKEEQERKEKGVLISERRYGSFHRRITLPADVDPDGVTARFKDGVLTVTLAKDEQARARKRKIAVEKA